MYGWFLWVLLNTPTGRVRVVNIYGPHTVSGRDQMWRWLKEQLPQDTDIEWCVGGDFNFICDGRDKRGGNPWKDQTGSEWWEFIEVGLGFKDPWLIAKSTRDSRSCLFSWTNGQAKALIKERLDRFYLPTSWRQSVV